MNPEQYKTPHEKLALFTVKMLQNDPDEFYWVIENDIDFTADPAAAVQALILMHEAGIDLDTALFKVLDFCKIVIELNKEFLVSRGLLSDAAYVSINNVGRKMCLQAIIDRETDQVD